MGLSKTTSELKLIDSNGETHILKIKPGCTVLEIAVENSVDLTNSCGGMGTCGTCRIRLQVTRGEVPERNAIENEMATERGYAPDERLSCQLEVPNADFAWSGQSLGSLDDDTP